MRMMTMDTMRTWCAVFALLLDACGGGSAEGGGGVRTGGGGGRRSGGGTNVNAAAESAFNEAVGQWRRAEHAGWNNERCEEVAEAFKEAAEENQGGRFPEAWFNAGLAYSKCRSTADQAVAMWNRALQARETY